MVGGSCLNHFLKGKTMKEKIFRRLWLFVGLFVSLALISTCAFAAKKIISEPGLYKNSELGFSMTWPAEVLSVSDKLNAGEIIRVRAANAYKIPVLHVAVSDKAKDAKPLSDFKAIAKAYKNGLKASQKATKSKRFKLRESKLVTLSNGAQGVFSMTTWKYGGSFGLVTLNLTLYAGEKVINVGITSAPGNPPVEVIEKWLMAAVVEP